MTRSHLLLLLLSQVLVLGCAQSIAVTDVTLDILPEKTPERDETVGEQKNAAAEPSEQSIPPVLLSTIHAQWCTKGVDDIFPQLQLPHYRAHEMTSLESLYGKRATVVVFWKEDRWMSKMALEDLQYQVAQAHEPADVAVVGIAVQVSKGNAQRFAGQAQAAEIPHLLDVDGAALAEVGSVALPRIYVLDPAGKIVWFDIEYSESTRRELLQTVEVLVGKLE